MSDLSPQSGLKRTLDRSPLRAGCWACGDGARTGAQARPKRALKLFAPSCGDARRTSTTAACSSFLTARPRATSGSSRSWCSSASISPFAVSCVRGADLALAAPPCPSESIVVTTRAGLRVRGRRQLCLEGQPRRSERTMAAVASEPGGRGVRTHKSSSHVRSRANRTLEPTWPEGRF